jgi:hypothetical protein
MLQSLDRNSDWSDYEVEGHLQCRCPLRRVKSILQQSTVHWRKRDDGWEDDGSTQQNGAHCLCCSALHYQDDDNDN